MDKLRTFLEALPLPITGVDRAGRIRFWNAAAERFLGWTAAEVLGKQHPAIPPERIDESARLRETTFRGEVIPRWETRRLRRDGSQFDVVITTAGLLNSSSEVELGLAVYHDLTDMREVQSRVRNAEHRYRVLLDSVTDVAVLIVSPDGTIVDCNTGADRILGPDCSPAASPEVLRELAIAREHGHFTGERWYARSDGSRFWADVVITSVPDTAGAITGYVVIIRDVTERKISHDKVQERSLQNAAVASFAEYAITERSPDILARTALESIVVALGADRVELLCLAPDRTSLRMTHSVGAEREPVADISIARATIYAETFELGAPVVRPLTEKDYQSAPHLRGLDYGLATTVASGQFVYVLTALSLKWSFDTSQIDSVQAISSMYAAAVARSSAEDQLADQQSRLRLMLEQIPTIISTVDADLRFTSTQGAGLRHVGLQPGDLVGATLFELGAVENSPPVQAARVALRGESTTFQSTFRGRAFDNLVEPLRDRDGKIVGIVNVGLDVTEHRKTNEDLRQSREQLRRLSAAMNQVQEDERRRIAREVHDELGQRLTALRLDLGLMRAELRADKRDAAEKRIETMFELIDETLSTVRRVATELRPTVLDHFGFRAAVEHELKAFSDRTGISVAQSIGAVSIDDDRATALYRILQEALTNVARHSGARNVDVSITQEAGRVTAEVRDNGRGITQEELDSMTTLGLLGVRERAYAFGGEVIIEGAAGAGTRVFVTIPNENSDR